MSKVDTIQKLNNESVFMEVVKEKIDNLKFNEEFERRKSIDEDIEILEELCDCVNINRENVSDEELFELALQHENVTIFKNKLFENIKLHINNIAKYYCGNSKKYNFERCRDVLVKYLCDEFISCYVFSYNQLTHFLTKDDLDLDRGHFNELYFEE